MLKSSVALYLCRSAATLQMFHNYVLRNKMHFSGKERGKERGATLAGAVAGARYIFRWVAEEGAELLFVQCSGSGSGAPFFPKERERESAPFFRSGWQLCPSLDMRLIFRSPAITHEALDNCLWLIIFSKAKLKLPMLSECGRYIPRILV